MTNILLSHITQTNENVIKIVKNELVNVKYVGVILYSFFNKDIFDNNAYQLEYGKNGPYRKKIENAFTSFGVNPSQLHFIDYYLDDPIDVARYLAKCDCIFFPGGSPNEMMKRINDRKIGAALSGKKVYIGSSAGAMIQFAIFPITPDDDYNKFSFVKGLGYLTNAFLLVHYEHKWLDQIYINELCKVNTCLLLREDGVCVLKNGLVSQKYGLIIKKKI
jgi:hypothetical protein